MTVTRGYDRGVKECALAVRLREEIQVYLQLY